MAKKHHDHLKNVPLFAGLDDKELDEIERLTTNLDFPAGEVLMTEGGYAQEMYIVVKGTLAISMDGDQITTLSDGDFVGELALLTHAHRSATVTAETEVEVLHIDGPSFASMLHEVPQIAVKMLPIVAQRAHDMAHAEGA